MRSSLEIIERVEMYVTGNLPSHEQHLFEAELAHSPQLREMVENQQFIQQAIQRKAILAEVQMYAPKFGGSVTFWGRFKWPIILSTTLLIITSVLFISWKSGREIQESKAQRTKHFIPETIENEVMIYGDSIPENADPSQSNEVHKVKVSMKNSHLLKSTVSSPSTSLNNKPKIESPIENGASNKSEVGFFKVEQEIIQVSTPEISSNSNDKIENWIVQPIFDAPDVPASFSDGKRGISKFISENVNYPEEAIELKIQGQIDVKFIVDEQGHICDAEAMNPNPETLLLEMEAIRLIQSMPPWIPAENNGMKVKSWVKVPVNFILK